ncbi:MAG: hypothetical protein EZS28_018549 [Streblomastix strix]|uniref:Uncharacterized protein n=1 Tax=Streblomastix strix TaxID=222440 RepID=A0A5J4VU20_9EUKA|nr:MAG: hypothetical protein EZS28_018549 [Streblomastix strix]
MKGQTRYLNKEVRQGEKGVTNYYPRLTQRQGNDLLSPYLLILPLAHPKYRNDVEGWLERMEYQCRDKNTALSKFDNGLSIKRGWQRVASTNRKKKQDY